MTDTRVGPTDRILLEALPVAIYVTDAEGSITYYNSAAAEFWGTRPEIGTAKWCGSWRLFTLEGEPLPHDQCQMATTLKTAVEPVPTFFDNGCVTMVGIAAATSETVAVLLVTMPPVLMMVAA